MHHLPKIHDEENVVATIAYTKAPCDSVECGILLGSGPFPLDSDAFRAQHGSVLVASDEEKCFENQLVPKQCVIRNARGIEKDYGPRLTTHGFELITGLQGKMQRATLEMNMYLSQVEHIVKDITGADTATAYCHVQRAAMKQKDKTSGYACYAHTDQAHESWSATLKSPSKDERALPTGLANTESVTRASKASRYAIVSAWRYLGPSKKCHHSHLAILDPTTVRPNDFMHFSLRCRDKKDDLFAGSNYRLNASAIRDSPESRDQENNAHVALSGHSWWYFPGMDCDDELLLFTVFDSSPHSFHNAKVLPVPTMFHSAFRDPRASASDEPDRESIDVRVFLTWD